MSTWPASQSSSCIIEGEKSARGERREAKNMYR
jgi:hypothetical protein